MTIIHYRRPVDNAVLMVDMQQVCHYIPKRQVVLAIVYKSYILPRRK